MRYLLGLLALNMLLPAFAEDEKQQHTLPILREKSLDYTPFALDFNRFPTGGNYAAKKTDLLAAADGLQQAVQVNPDHPDYLSVNTAANSPAAPNSFCSSAVGLYEFAQIQALQQRPDNAYAMLRDPELNAELANIGKKEDIIGGVLDGKGFFGHLNANSIGVAVLYKKLHLGPNFIYGTQPIKKGDILKIFWNHNIGAPDEFGHLVVVDKEGLGPDDAPADKKKHGVFFWSSSKSTGGYGLKFVPDSDIALGVVSRMEHPENLVNWKSLPLEGSEAMADHPAIDGKNDPYLARMGKEPGTLSELAKNAGIVLSDDFIKKYNDDKATEDDLKKTQKKKN